MLEVLEGKTIVVWFSCGAASAVAAKYVVDLYGSNNTIRIVNNPISEEGDDNHRFLNDVERWIGHPIEKCVNPKFPDASIVQVFDKLTYMSGIYGAVCTSTLKKDARKYWEQNNTFDHIVMGFTSEEKGRLDRFKLTERSNVIDILGFHKIGKQECIDIIVSAGIELPEAYRMGFVNANCKGCVKATSPTYWNKVREVYPDVFKERAEQSRRLGCRLVRYKGKRLFLDELPVEAKGRSMKTLKMPDCGIFCEEKFK